MVLYINGDIEISKISNEDTANILKLYSENDFGCDYEIGSLRPSNHQLSRIMDSVISGKDDESNIFVLKNKGVFVGYVSCFVEYDRLTIGHIAVENNFRSMGYGSILTEFAVAVAENEDRDVSLFCTHPNSCFKKKGFETSDGLHYFHKSQGRKIPEFPKLFVGIDEYKKRQDEKMKKETERFAKFLTSDVIKTLREL